MNRYGGYDILKSVLLFKLLYCCIVRITYFFFGRSSKLRLVFFQFIEQFVLKQRTLVSAVGTTIKQKRVSPSILSIASFCLLPTVQCHKFLLCDILHLVLITIQPACTAGHIPLIMRGPGHDYIGLHMFSFAEQLVVN